MPTFRYTDEQPRVYPTLVGQAEVEKGSLVDADENPDPRRFAEVIPPKPGKSEKPSGEGE